MKHKMTILALLIFALALQAQPVFGQAGYSSASMSRSRAGYLPRLADIRIEEFINYHRHQIDLPKKGKRVELDVRWNKLNEKDAILQIGMATPRAIDSESLPPLNLVLVIDRSGSMSGPRIEKVREAILAFVEGLRKDDLVTIVGFNEQATVHLKACKKTDSNQIAKAVKSVQATGYTNLHAGLMLGYREAIKNFDEARSNRVILLSDGISNRGQIDPEIVAEDSRKFNKKGIELSTIGLGSNFNEKLLRELADAGRGQIHFVADENDIKKTFIDELDSLLAPAARKVRLSVGFDDRESVRFFGYERNQQGSSGVFRLDNFNCGLTQVVMAKVKDFRQVGEVDVKLTYEDALTGKKIKLEQTVDFQDREAAGGFLADTELRKNFAITKLANSIRLALEKMEKKEFHKAQKKLQNGIDFAKEYYPKGKDKDVDRMLKIVRDYQEKFQNVARWSSEEDDD